MSCKVIDRHKCQWVNVDVCADVYVVSGCYVHSVCFQSAH